MFITPEELIIAARTVWQEARGEPREGKRAVVHVLANRAAARRTDLATEALRPWQFSGWNAGEVNREPSRRVTLVTPSFRHCMVAVLEALDDIEASIDPTSGARHYHAETVNPPWAAGHTPCVVIGRHRFYNTVA